MLLQHWKSYGHGTKARGGAKLFDLKFFVRKSFHKVVNPAAQNHLHKTIFMAGQSAQYPGLDETHELT